MKYKLGFLGAGNMAEAIAAAAESKSVLTPQDMIASDPSDARRDVFAAMGIAVTTDNAEVVSLSEQIMLAVKPQVMPEAAADLASGINDEQVVISIMAGIGTAKLASAVGKAIRVVRVMPNTPMMVGSGMAGIALGDDAQEGDDELAMQVFQAGGEAVRVDEALIDAITAVSGSGPAYLFYLAEAMTEAAAKLGLAEHASLLVQQTIIGAAKLLCQSTDTPAELRRKVTSKGGTTEAAIKHMETNGARQAIVEAIEAAQKRAVELGA